MYTAPLILLLACASNPSSPPPATQVAQPAPPAATAPAEAPAAPEGPVWPEGLSALDGQPLPAGAVQGQVVLVVNVASRCGYTPQYEGLQALHDRFAGRGFTVLGVPCNQFGGQEPGSADEIATFCRLNYGVSFPLLDKQDVNGPSRSPLYRALVASEVGAGHDVQWNFEKFLVGRDGRVIQRYNSAIRPDDAELVQDITAALDADPGSQGAEG